MPAHINLFTTIFSQVVVGLPCGFLTGRSTSFRLDGPGCCHLVVVCDHTISVFVLG